MLCNLNVQVSRRAIIRPRIWCHISHSDSTTIWVECAGARCRVHSQWRSSASSALLYKYSICHLLGDTLSHHCCALSFSQSYSISGYHFRIISFGFPIFAILSSNSRNFYWWNCYCPSISGKITIFPLISQLINIKNLY